MTFSGNDNCGISNARVMALPWQLFKMSYEIVRYYSRFSNINYNNMLCLHCDFSYAVSSLCDCGAGDSARCGDTGLAAGECCLCGE